jgi:hypothetical protein
MRGEVACRVNDQWRICFRWRDGDAFDVEIVDYHRRRKRDIAPIHPGEILKGDFLEPLKLSVNAVS